jgi:hypothetical protein
MAAQYDPTLCTTVSVGTPENNNGLIFCDVEYGYRRTPAAVGG